MPNANSLQNSLPSVLPASNQQGGTNLNEIYKERILVGGRIKKSLLEFLYKEKSQTKKKNNYIRKLGSRKR